MKTKRTSHHKSLLLYILFFLFFAALSGLGSTLAYIPAILIGLISTFLAGYTEYLQPEIQFLFISMAPPILLLIPFVLVLKLTKPIYFFIATTILFSLGHLIDFQHAIPHLENDTDFILTAIIYIVVLCATLTFVWQDVFLFRNRLGVFIIALPLLIDIAFILIGWDFVYNTYIAVGNYLNIFYRFNFFWLDLSGFAIIFLNLLSCAAVLLYYGIQKVSKRFTKT